MAGGRPRKRAAPKSSPNKSPKSPKKENIDIDTPPFPSPGKKHLKALKPEKSSKSSQTFYFERLGDGNMCLFWIEKPSGEGGCIHPIDLVAQTNAKEGKEWRQHTNCICPTLSRCEGRHQNVPIPAKFSSSLNNGENSYPWRCFFGYKNDKIPHDQCVTYVMKQAVKVINNHSKFSTDYVIDSIKSDKTENPDGPYRSLDSVVIDKAVQSIIYRYFYEEHLTDSNFDEERNSYVVPEDITTPQDEIARFLWRPGNGSGPHFPTLQLANHGLDWRALLNEIRANVRFAVENGPELFPDAEHAVPIRPTWSVSCVAPCSDT